MSVGFIEEEDKEETVPVAVSFKSGEKVTWRLTETVIFEILRDFADRKPGDKAISMFASENTLVSFDLSEVVKIEVVSRKSKKLLARINEAL